MRNVQRLCQSRPIAPALGVPAPIAWSAISCWPVRPAMTIVALTVLVITGLPLLGGCDRGGTGTVPANSAAPPVAPTQPTRAERENVEAFFQGQSAARPPTAEGLPPGHPPLSAATQPVPPPAAPRPAAAALTYTVPESWQKEPVRSAMRADQYRLPRVEGDPEDGELAIFAAGIGGTVAANLQRWRGQFTTSEGAPLPDSAVQQEVREINGLKVTVIEITGRYDPGAMMPGATGPKADYRMLGAAVETPAGPWYFKASGPAATMARHRAGFFEMLDSLAPR